MGDVSGIITVMKQSITTETKEITVNDFRGQLTTSSDALQFMLAGDARITIVNSDTKSRFTYRISAPYKEPERGAGGRGGTSPRTSGSSTSPTTRGPSRSSGRSSFRTAPSGTRARAA